MDGKKSQGTTSYRSLGQSKAAGSGGRWAWSNGWQTRKHQRPRGERGAFYGRGSPSSKIARTKSGSSPITSSRLLIKAVDLEAVRAEFYKSHPATGDATSKAETRRRAFNRAVSDATLTGLIGTRDIGAITFIWLEVPHENV